MQQTTESNTTKKFLLRKKHKLKSRKTIEQLFKTGSSYKTYPLKAVFLRSEETNTKIGVSVPKKLFKKAVDRNRIKRLIREVYRLHQYSLETTNNIMFIYISKEKMNYKKIENAMLSVLKQINNKQKI